MFGLDILTLLKAVLSLADVVARYARDRQLLEAGEAEAIKNNLYDTNKKLEAAIKARRKISKNLGDIVNDMFNRDKSR